MMHGRIEYPKVLAAGEAGRAADLESSAQPADSVDLTISRFESGTGSESDLPRDAAVPSKTNLPRDGDESIEMLHALEYLQAGAIGTSANPDDGSALAPLVEAEVLYGRPVAERPSAADPDDRAPTGSATRARGGKSRARRS
jgi:hypothetical protein